MHGQRNQAPRMFEPLLILNMKLDISINMDPTIEENIV